MTGLVAAVEAGGTSFVACVANISDDDNKNPEILFRRNVDSSHDKPHKTLDDIANFFEQHKPESGYRALGVATFGPVGLVKGRKNYGCILPGSPKQAWRSVDLLTPLTTACQGKDELAVKIETDVNAPALAEYLLVKDQVTSVAYVTVGTGVGKGFH
jgi:fructokinase